MYRKGFILSLFSALFLLPLLSPSQLQASPDDYESLLSEGNDYYQRGSFAKAKKSFEQAQKLAATKSDKRFIKFRLADSAWRALDGTTTHDRTKFTPHQKSLQEIVNSSAQLKQQDKTWAEANESLADFNWTRRNSRNWYAAQKFYNQALQWWGKQSVSKESRSRYLQIVWKIAEPPYRNNYYYYGYHGNILPIATLYNADKIAISKNDKARISYLIAMTLKQSAHNKHQEIVKAFEKSLSLGKESSFYDDALFHLAKYNAERGNYFNNVDSPSPSKPSLAKAVKLFERFLEEFPKGESQYVPQARSELKRITGPQLNLHTSNTFFPGSEVVTNLSWRNLDKINFALYPVNLTKDIKFGLSNRASQWAQLIDHQPHRPVHTWIKNAKSKIPYKSENEQLIIEKKLEEGAYVLEARAGSLVVRDVVLVTNSTVLVKVSKSQAITFVTDAKTGRPLVGADVVLWQRYYQKNLFGSSNHAWRAFTGKTSEDGIAHFELMQSESNSEVFVSTLKNKSQAFAQSYNYYSRNSNERWKLYINTDRPAYRPEDAVQWKLTARTSDGYRYSTPANSALRIEILDPRGNKIRTEELTLNQFGSAWGTIELDKSMPLGEFRANFYSAKHNKYLGSDVLFRLEEYKLPEFKVSVKAANDADGEPRVFKLGESVQAEINASYYFGGAVADADVEIVVHKKPYFHYWHAPRKYPWFFQTGHYRGHHYRGYQPEQVITRKKLKTDKDGKVSFEFETPKESQQDLEFRIEARVIDSSRREISASDSIKVSRQSFYAYLNADRTLIAPKDKTNIRLRTMDANNRPVSSEGELSIWREIRNEIWVNPSGKEFSIKEIRRKYPNDYTKPSIAAGWKLKSSKHERRLISSTSLVANAKGEAVYQLQPMSDGYFTLRWESAKDSTAPIFAETSVWVGNNRTTDLDYRTNNLQLVVDNDLQKVGSLMPVMIASPSSNRWVLFTVEGEDIYHYQVAHIEGTAKLLNLPINRTHVPNINLQASTIADGYEQRVAKEIIVPPEEHYLDVEINTTKKEFRPREETEVEVITKDHQGNPVPAEVTLSVVDESVFYIQQDYTIDPRKFFFGEKRNMTVQTRSTFNHKRYISFLKDEDGNIQDARQIGNIKRDASIAPSIEALSTSGFAQGEMALEEGATMAADAIAAPTAMKAKGGGRRSERKRSVAKESRRKDGNIAKNESENGGADIVVRSDFRATALWAPSVVTDAKGKGKATVKFPDSLTAWKLRARVATAEDKFGTADGSVATSKPLMARLQAPRFFVVGDQVTLSAILNNNTDKDMLVRPVLKLSDEIVKTGIVQNGQAVKGHYSQVKVPANGEYRLDWITSVKKAGISRIKVSAQAKEHSDAMVKPYPVIEHGIEKLLATSTKIEGKQKSLTLEIPKAVREGSTEVELHLSPSIALTMLDALPYLAQYPYGCTEQTMSRFLPAVVSMKTMQQMGISAEDIAFRIFGGITPGSKVIQKRAKGDLKNLNRMIDAGLNRLYSFQHSDGGWGWWKGGRSDAYMTAYVVWGLSLAKDADVNVRGKVLRNGVNFLNSTLVEYEDQLDVQSWMLHALSEYNKLNRVVRASSFQRKAFENVYNQREKLNAYTRSLLALAAHNYGYHNEAGILIENLENGVIIDNPAKSQVGSIASGKHDSTAHWGSDGIWWRWSEGGIEATAFALKALSTISPNNKLIDPTLQWLVANRRGAQWSNTRDSAYVILALNQYLKQSKELVSDVDYEILVNGKRFTSGKINSNSILNAPKSMAVPRNLLKPGQNQITLKKKNGSGTIYLSARAKFFSLEEPIKAAGNKLFVTRKYYRLVNEETLLAGNIQKRVLLKDGEEIESGDRVEVVLAVEAKNNYEYLLLEDKKPAGFESVQLKSGESMSSLEISTAALKRIKEGAELSPPPSTSSSNRSTHQNTWNLRGQNQDWYTGRSRWVHQELRDQHVAIFIDKMPQGVWEVRYQLRAEVPGRFHALPTIAEAMYVPELKANSREQRVVVIEKANNSEEEKLEE